MVVDICTYIYICIRGYCRAAAVAVAVALVFAVAVAVAATK